MQSVALSLPDVIRSDWGSNSHDCFWGAVTHDCVCAAAKLSVAALASFFFLLPWLRAMSQKKKMYALKIHHGRVPSAQISINHFTQRISKYHHPRTQMSGFKRPLRSRAFYKLLHGSSASCASFTTPHLSSGCQPDENPLIQPSHCSPVYGWEDHDPCCNAIKLFS